MSSITPIENHAVNPANSTPSASDAVNAKAVASAHRGGSVDSNTTISSLDDLKKKAPKLHEQMLMGIGMSICRSMEHHQDELKKMMREYARNNR